MIPPIVDREPAEFVSHQITSGSFEAIMYSSKRGKASVASCPDMVSAKICPRLSPRVSLGDQTMLDFRSSATIDIEEHWPHLGSKGPQ